MNYEPKKYEEIYLTKKALEENEEIKNLLIEFKDDKLLDLGCGTGLVYDLIKPTNYIGVDINKEYLKYFKEKHTNTNLIFEDALRYLKICEDFDTIVAIFSLNYMKPEVIDYIIKKANKNIILIHYNEPYHNGSASYYEGLEKDFKEKHDTKKIQISYKLIKNNFTTKEFMGEKHYYISELRR